VTTRFIWEGFRLLQEIRDAVPLTYVYSDQHSHEPLARIDGVNTPDIYWFHNQPNGTPERLTDAEGQVCQEAQNSAWGKLLHERDVELPYAQNLRMQGQYLDRETGLHYNLFRYYDPDCARFTQQDPIGLAGGLNLYQYAPNPLGWVDPWGLSRCNQFDRNTVLKNIEASKRARHSSNISALNEWPPNRGFYGVSSKYTLLPGEKIDRYGHEYGTFVSPEGVPYRARALKPGTDKQPYTVYEVKRKITVDAGEVAPWFGYEGRGIQYELPDKVIALIKNGSLARL